MSSKGRIRQKRHLKQRLKKRRVCKVCVPMSVYTPTVIAIAGGTVAAINCPACGRQISFNTASRAAVDCLLLCLNRTGICTNGMQGVMDGKVVRAIDCNCGKPHIGFEAQSAATPITAPEV